MSSKYLTTFKLVNSVHEKSKYKLLCSLKKDSEGKDSLDIYKNNKFLLFYRLSKGITKDTENQTELPVEAIKWISETIKNGFWRRPSEGGFPKDKHSAKSIIAGEEIILTRTMNASYGERGFKIVNKSRKSHILKCINQQFSFTDQLYTEVLNPLFETL